MAAARGTEPLPTLEWGPIFEQHPLAHYVYDPESLQMLAANAAVLQRFGYTLSEFLALSPFDLLDPAELPAMRAYLAGIKAAGGGAAHRLWRARTRDGRILNADVQGMPVHFAGRPARLVAVVDAGAHTRLAADAEQARDLVFKAGTMAQLGGWAFDLEARRMHMSDVVCALHEVAPGTVIDLERALEFYPADAAAALRAASLQCRTQGTPFDLELSFTGARGAERWVRVAGEAVRNAAGLIVRIEGAQQDITERKRAAIDLERSRRRFAALLAAIPDLWIVFDAERRYVQISDPEHPSLSSPWAQRLGRRMVDILPPAIAQALERLMALAHSTGQPQAHEYEMVVKCAPRSFEARYLALDEGHTMALVRDVTEMLLLEKRFQAMMQTAPIGIFMTDAAGNCTYTNSAWQDLYGMTLMQSLGEGWSGNLHPDDRQMVRSHWMAAVQAVQAFELEFRIRCADGTLRRVAARSSPVMRADGALSGHVGTVVDLTQQRELEAARQAQAVAEEAGRRQLAFMSRVSHELRTPLNAILGFGQLLQHNPVLADARAQAHVGHVVHAGRHMLALVDDLLELQRLQQGGLQPKVARLEVGAMLEGCADMLRPLAQTAGVSIEVVLTVPIELHTDERCLRQILLNLGSNAVKYAGRAAHVVLSASIEGDTVRLGVADNGQGMTAEQVQRLFSPFERLGQDVTGVPGSGLGLVITRQLAQLLGGEVRLSSSPGKGTVATLELRHQAGPAQKDRSGP